MQRHFGEDIRREVVERLVPRYFRQAVAEKGIDPLLAPEVEMAKVESGTGDDVHRPGRGPAGNRAAQLS